MKKFNTSGPDQDWQNVVIIWIQTIWNSDSVPEGIFEMKKLILKINQ